MSKHFTHLHLHTEYSLLDGAIRVSDAIAFAKKHGWKALGMSDHGNIFGAVRFFQEAKKAGIKPILGCEMYLTPKISEKDAKSKYYHLIVIVQNKAGYANLCRLMAASYQEGFYFKPRIDYALLERYNEGLILSTACVGGHIPTLLQNEDYAEAERIAEWGLRIFGRERFFLELMPCDIDKQKVVNERLIALGKKMGIDCIVTGDAHYLCEDDHEAHEVFLAIQTKHKLSDPDRMTFGDFRGHLKTPEYFLTEFPEQEDAVWRTGEIADRCTFDFETDRLFFPLYPVPQSFTPETYFAHLCAIGLEKLHTQGRIADTALPQYQARLDEEVSLICKMGYVGYFLIVSDFIQWAKRQHIPVGPGRGSAAGSLVAWALEITNVDPIAYNLLFERFLNPERVSMPDIDIDFCIERREDVITYVKEKYGHDAVCQIITFGTMMAKGVIKDVARTLGLPFQDANHLTELIPDQLKITLDEAIEQEPELKRLIESDPSIEKIISIGKKLEGLTRHASKHAAGVVISPEPLRDVIPLYIPPKTNELVTQYAMTELETLGFLKMDFLGLKNLTVISYALGFIKQTRGIDINLDTLPLDDPKAFELLAEGKTNAIFQFESSGLKDVLRKLKPSRFEDLIAVNALYRPGPLGSGMVDDFIERRHGRKKTSYMFDELEPILGETYGVIVYQEQVMKIASTIAGYSLGSADILRRAMGKKKADVMAEQKKLFVDGARAKKFDEKKAGELFDLMAYFAGYGFNKSHSTAYALIAYHTAYLKARYPREFMAAVLSFETSDPDQLRLYLHEAHEMGIVLERPDINTSRANFTPGDTGIIFGLKGIRNLGETAITAILAESGRAPFADLADFCTRVDLRVVNKRTIESLIYAGAFDTLPGNRNQKISELDTIIAQAHDRKEREKTGQLDLFSLFAPTAASSEKGETPRYIFSPREELPLKEKLNREKEVVGFYLSTHPLLAHRSLLESIAFDSIESLALKIKGGLTSEPFVALPFLLHEAKHITTKKGDKMAFLIGEDLTGSVEVIVFPTLYKKSGDLLATGGEEWVILGKLALDSLSPCKIKAEAIYPLSPALLHEKLFVRCELTLSPEETTREGFAALKEALGREPAGSLPLVIYYTERGEHFTLKTRYTLSPRTELRTRYQGFRLIFAEPVSSAPRYGQYRSKSE